MGRKIYKRHIIHRFIVLITLALNSVSCVMLSESPQFASQIQGKSNRLQFSTENQGDILVDVFSDSGLGAAEIEQIAGPKPRSIMLRFHLAGLEGLTLSYDEVKIHLSISSRGNNEIMQEITFVHREQSSARLIQTNEPYWLETIIHSDIPSSQNRIPLKNGTIDVLIPQSFFRDNHRAFSIEWIDFYR